MASDGTVYVELAWPESSLSPNRARSLHWSVISRAKRLYRERCMLEAGSAVPAEDRGPTYPMEARLVFCPPDRRSYDLDNLYSRMKAGIDGVADALGFNDKQIRRAVLEFGEVEPAGKVCLHLVPMVI